jgi:hypothetical protein
VKRLLSTFAEQPLPAALQVVAERLDERMRCSDGLGHQRGGVLRIGGCSSRTGANADRTQRASISSHRAVRTNNIDGMVLHRSAAACGSSCRSCKTKERTARQRNKLFSRRLKCNTATDRGCVGIEQPTDGVATRCVGRFLHPPQLTALGAVPFTDDRCWVNEQRSRLTRRPSRHAHAGTR